jgi:hypothetical protein
MMTLGTMIDRVFNASDMLFMAAVADQVAIALDRARQFSNEARTDHLTGLANRREFERVMEREVALSERHERRLSMMMIDLDNLKRINDRQGHSSFSAWCERRTSARASVATSSRWRCLRPRSSGPERSPTACAPRSGRPPSARNHPSLSRSASASPPGGLDRTGRPSTRWRTATYTRTSGAARRTRERFRVRRNDRRSGCSAAQAAGGWPGAKRYEGKPGMVFPHRTCGFAAGAAPIPV